MATVLPKLRPHMQAVYDAAEACTAAALARQRIVPRQRLLLQVESHTHAIYGTGRFTFPSAHTRIRVEQANIVLDAALDGLKKAQAELMAYIATFPVLRSIRAVPHMFMGNGWDAKAGTLDTWGCALMLHHPNITQHKQPRCIPFHPPSLTGLFLTLQRLPAQAIRLEPTPTPGYTHWRVLRPTHPERGIVLSATTPEHARHFAPLLDAALMDSSACVVPV